MCGAKAVTMSLDCGENVDIYILPKSREQCMGGGNHVNHSTRLNLLLQQNFPSGPKSNYKGLSPLCANKKSHFATEIFKC